MTSPSSSSASQGRGRGRGENEKDVIISLKWQVGIKNLFQLSSQHLQNNPPSSPSSPLLIRIVGWVDIVTGNEYSINDDDHILHEICSHFTPPSGDFLNQNHIHSYSLYSIVLGVRNQWI